MKPLSLFSCPTHEAGKEKEGQGGAVAEGVIPLRHEESQQRLQPRLFDLLVDLHIQEPRLTAFAEEILLKTATVA